MVPGGGGIPLGPAGAPPPGKNDGGAGMPPGTEPGGGPPIMPLGGGGPPIGGPPMPPVGGPLIEGPEGTIAAGTGAPPVGEKNIIGAFDTGAGAFPFGGKPLPGGAILPEPIGGIIPPGGPDAGG